MIAVDLNGGDFAPRSPIRGMNLALKWNFVTEEELCAIGQTKVFETRSWRWFSRWHKVKTIVADNESTIVTGMNGVKTGAFNVFVSAGNTANVVIRAVRQIGCIADIKPAIGVTLPDQPHTLFLDIGAVLDFDRSDFLNLARMGIIYAKLTWQIAEPKVALLNIGIEPNKGYKTDQDIYAEFSRHPDLHFVGNVEPDKLFEPELNADVVVCRGKEGNLVLKAWEGAKISDGKKSWEMVGGLPLLGILGNVIIAHGKSNARAVANAIKAAKAAAELGINQQIAKLLAEPAAVLSTIPPST